MAERIADSSESTICTGVIHLIDTMHLINTMHGIWIYVYVYGHTHIRTHICMCICFTYTHTHMTDRGDFALNANLGHARHTVVDNN